MGANIIYLEYVIAAGIRFWLLESDYNPYVEERVEISTPLNAWNRVKEGVILFNKGINPYDGDLFHETPIILLFFVQVIKLLTPMQINLLFVSLDLITAHILHKAAAFYTKTIISRQEREKGNYASGVDSLMVTQEDISLSSIFVVSAYLFNPYSILNCAAKTTTVISNVLLSIVFYSMLTCWHLVACLFLALCTLQSMYPATLIVPICLYARNTKGNLSCIVKPALFFPLFLLAFFYTSRHITGNWDFIDSTFIFILNVSDLKPNIGLFWYFFTEMFEHFRPLFVYAFQINAAFLYVVPLSLRLKDEPVLLAFALTAISTVFKSYPSVGDVAFYLALLPMWKHLFPFFQQGFFVVSFFFGCSLFAPIVWHLWIYSGSANANFYFGVTLAFATTQIFLITDMLFGHIKREYSMKRGIISVIETNKGKLSLE